MTTTDHNKPLRDLWRAYHAACDRIYGEWVAAGCHFPMPPFPDWPDALSGLTCGAKTQQGHPCTLTALHSNGRCKWHGGMATGPKTEAGKEQSRINGRRGGRPRKTEHKVSVKT